MTPDFRSTNSPATVPLFVPEAGDLPAGCQPPEEPDSRVPSQISELRAAVAENSRLIAAINSAATGVILSDALQAGRPIIFVNDAFCEITGYRRDEVIGRNCRFLQGPDTDPAMISQMRTAMAAQRPYHGTLLNYRKNGERFWNGLTINPVFDDQGQLANFVGVQADLTARVEELERVRQSEAQLALAQRVARLGSWEQTFTNGQGPTAERLIWSEETFRIFGRVPDLAADVWALFENGVHPDDWEAVQAAYADAVHHGRDYSIDFRIVRPDGSERFVHEEADFVFEEGTDRLLRVVGTVQDITERKRAELATVHLAALVESSQDAVIGKTLEGIITHWNQAATATYGHTEAEAVGQSCLHLLVPPDRLEEAVDVLRRLAQGRRVPPFETIRLRKGGAPIHVSVSMSPIIDANGVVIAVSSISRDITEQKRTAEYQRAKEEAERASHAKSEFLSRMSHELRTPLNAILGFGQLLELSPLSDDDIQCVRYILKGGRHLLGLVDEVLDLARVEAGKTVLTFSAVSFVPLAGECVDFVARMAHARRVTCSVEASPAGAIPVWADAQRVKQILLNLLSNAIKYNREEGRVVVDCEPMSNGQVRLNVRDTGAGISPEGLRRLFVPFERLDQESGTVEGSGLGLAVSRRLAEAMGGSMGAESRVGQGSTFWVELPAAAPAGSAGAGSVEPAPLAVAAPAPLPQATVLYVEDNASNLQVVKMVIARLRPQWQFLSARDGQDGLRQAREHRPSVILLDLQLPGIKGDAVLAELRGDPAVKSIPVLLLSADATDHSRQRLLALGADDYVSKPFNVGVLLDKLDRLIIAAADGRPRVSA